MEKIEDIRKVTPLDKLGTAYSAGVEKEDNLADDKRTHDFQAGAEATTDAFNKGVELYFAE